MSKKVFCIILFIPFWISSVEMQAQSSILNNIKQTLGTTLQTATDTGVGTLFDAILGTAAVSQKELAGTWRYGSPAVLFESEDLLKSAGGSLVASALEKKMQTHLNRIGITKGKMTLSFNLDNTFVCSVGARKFNGNYTLDGAQITLSYLSSAIGSIVGNVSVSNSKLILSFEADKLLRFINVIGTKVNNSTIKTISNVAGSYDGMQLGFRFEK